MASTVSPRGKGSRGPGRHGLLSHEGTRGCPKATGGGGARGSDGRNARCPAAQQAGRRRLRTRQGRRPRVRAHHGRPASPSHPRRDSAPGPDSVPVQSPGLSPQTAAPDPQGLPVTSTDARVPVSATRVPSAPAPTRRAGRPATSPAPLPRAATQTSVTQTTAAFSFRSYECHGHLTASASSPAASTKTARADQRRGAGRGPES